MKYHRTKDGRKILLADMEINHLRDTIKLIERRAIRGITIKSGGGTTADDMWYDEDLLEGEEALKYMNYQSYVNELQRRG